MPAVAVDRAGRRLGRGGGSYDSALARVGAAIQTVALLYEGELVSQVAGRPARPAGPRSRESLAKESAGFASRCYHLAVDRGEC